MNKKIIFLSLAVVIIAFCTVSFIFSDKEENQQKVVFIENNTVFESFQMKKDYDKILEKDLMMESQKLDSLGNLVNGMSQDPKVSGSMLEVKKAEYFAAKKVFEENFSKLSKEYTSQVYERLNTYIQEFGKQKNYRMIVGANGQGNVMYVEKSADVTKELITYINKEYLDK